MGTVEDLRAAADRSAEHWASLYELNAGRPGFDADSGKAAAVERLMRSAADDLALALRLLDAFTANDDGRCARYGARITCEAHEMWDLDPDGPCPGAEAHALLVRHGFRA